MGDAGIKSAIQGSNVFFFFNDTATTEIYTTHNTLSLHDALPISNQFFILKDLANEQHQSIVRIDPFDNCLEIGRAHV